MNGRDNPNAAIVMENVAAENEMILMETDHSMYHTVGELYCNGLPPIY